MLSRRVGSGGDADGDDFGFRVVLVCFPPSFSSRLIQSTTGSETASAWIAFGSVRARAVARRPPICEPYRLSRRVCPPL